MEVTFHVSQNSDERTRVILDQRSAPPASQAFATLRFRGSSDSPTDCLTIYLSKEAGEALSPLIPAINDAVNIKKQPAISSVSYASSLMEERDG